MLDYIDLAEEQRAKLAGASTPEDIFRIAKEEGYELSEEEMEQISGGIFGWEGEKCKKCGGPLAFSKVHGRAFCRKCGAIHKQ